MSLTVLSKKLEVLNTLTVVKEEHVDDALVAAERSEKGRQDGVSNTEARALNDFFMRAAKPGTSAPTNTKVRTPTLEQGAVRKFNAFFVAHDLPYGENKGPMKERVLRTLESTPLGAALDRTPRTGNLQPLKLDDERLAYVDIVKHQFVLRVGQDYFGPFALDANAPAADAANAA